VAFDPKDQADALIYANWVRIGRTPFEISIDLGYRSAPAPPESFPVRVLMAPEHAKSLQVLLNDALADYEAEVGPIRELPIDIGPARLPQEFEAEAPETDR